MVSLMAAVMAVQTGLIYSVQKGLPNAHTCGIAAAAMLFIFQGGTRLVPSQLTISIALTAWARSVHDWLPSRCVGVSQ